MRWSTDRASIREVIEVTAARTKRAIVYHFRDPDPGFDRGGFGTPLDRSIRRTSWRPRGIGPRWASPGGLGILIARQIADELVFNERGNEVLLVKYL